MPKKSLADIWEAAAWPLVFVGGVGTGKSCTAAILYRLAKVERAAIFDFSLLVRSITQTWITGGPLFGYGQREALADEALQALGRFDFVVFDDIATRKPTEAQADAAFEICKTRIGKPTIYTCNLKPSDIVRTFDERFADRILAGTVINFTGKSMRTGI